MKGGSKIVIILLVVIIIALVGFSGLMVHEYLDERDEHQVNNNQEVVTDNSQNNSEQNSNGNNANNQNNNQSNNQNNNQNNTGNQYISRDDAINYALSHAGLNRSDVYDLNVELENKYSNTVYEVDFNYDKYEYEYYINAVDGTIVKSFKEIDY